MVMTFLICSYFGQNTLDFRNGYFLGEFKIVPMSFGLVFDVEVK